MKAFILLAAAGLGTLVALPHLPDLAAIKNQVDAVLATTSTQLSQPSQPAQPEQTVQNTPLPPNGTVTNDPSSTPAPFIAKASPEEVRQTYGEPQHVERSVYGETWYYPVYIIYFRNGYVHRVHRSTSSNCMATSTMPLAPVRTTRTAMSGPIATTASLTTHPQPQPQPWRFSSNSALGTVTLNGPGVQRANSFVPQQTVGVPNTTGATHSTGATYPTGATYSDSNYHSGGSYSTGGGSSTGMCNRPATTSTATAPHPVVVQRTAPVTTAPAYAGSRVGY